jgi:hypothetical protein
VRKPAFVAITHTGEAAGAARYIAGALTPRDVAEIPAQSGGILLCSWGNPPPQGDASLLAVVDGTSGSPEVPYPAALLDAPGVPAARLAMLRQDRSYLWLDDIRRPVFWTDHAGFSRIYHVRAGGCDVFSDCQETLARLTPGPDAASVAYFLANGSTSFDRTLHAGLSALPVASVVTMSAEGPVARRYWDFRPGQDADPDTASVKRGMWERIEACVAARTADRQVTLPLSGGYDSPMLLGLLHRRGVPLTAFSYVNGEPHPHSDAAMARRHAERLGVAHRTHRIDGADTMGLIQANLEQGLRMRGICNELGAYRQAAADARERFSNPMFVFGDHLFGQRTLRLRSDADMLGASAVKHPDVLQAYAPLVGTERLPVLQRSVADDYRRLLDLAPPFKHRDDVKDWLYAVETSDWDMASMRAHTAGPLLPFTVPMLDIAMLDFLRHVHFRHRLDKRLYRRVCEENVPQIFQIPRSRDRQGIADVAAVLRRDEASIRDVTKSLDAAVPGLAVPGGFDAMLDSVLGAGPPPTGGPLISRQEAAGLELFRNLTRLQIMPLHWLQPLKRQFWNTHQIVPDQAYLFRRALHLAMGFRQQAAPIRLPPVS